MAYRVSSCLLVGLGGTGQDSLAYIKKRMLETYGAIPPVVRFLSIDADKLKANNSVLESDEYTYLKVEDVENYRLVRPQVDEWLDTEHVPWQKFRQIKQGAGQIRMLGRLALDHHLGGVVRLISRKLDEINDSRTQLADFGNTWSISEATPQVIFFGSIAGGTGGGTLLDLAAAVKSMPEANQFETVAYLMLPGVFRKKVNTELVEENGYAFLRELDYFSSDVEAVKARPDLFEYQLGASTYSMAGPFDRIMLVDNERADNIRYADSALLSEAIALAVLTTTGGPIGDEAESVLCNPGNELSTWEDGKRPLYSTFGICEVHYPSQMFAEYGTSVFVDRLARLILEGDSGEGDAASAETVRVKFIADNHLAELGGTDNEIGNAILPYASTPVTLNIPKELKADQISGIWRDNENRIAQFKEAQAAKTAGNRDELAKSLEAKLRGEIVRLAQAERGSLALVVASQLRGYFEAVADESIKGDDSDEAKARAMAKRASDDAKSLEDSAVAATKKWFSAEVVRKIKGNYQTALTNVARLEAAQIRAKAVAVLCQSMVAVLDDVIVGLEQQNAAGAALLTATTTERTKLQKRLSGGGEFEQVVTPPLENPDIPTPVPADFWTWLEQSKQMDVLSFGKLDAQKAYDTLNEYASAIDVTRNLREANLMSVIKDMDEAGLDKMVHSADKKAMPLLSCNKGVVEANSKDAFMAPSYQYIIGAPKGFLQMFTPDQLGDKSQTESGSSSSKSLTARLTSTEIQSVRAIELDDVDRAYFFKFYGGVPAYALSLFDLMRDEYNDLNARKGQWSLHLDKRWGDVLPDPMPQRKSKGADITVWALAVSDISALNKIRQSQDHFTFLHLEPGERIPVESPIAQGRMSACTEFLRNSAWVAECQAAIDLAYRDMSNSEMKAELERWVDSLEMRFGQDSKNYEIAKEERDAIRRYIREKLA